MVPNKLVQVWFNNEEYSVFKAYADLLRKRGVLKKKSDYEAIKTIVMLSCVKHLQSVIPKPTLDKDTK